MDESSDPPPVHIPAGGILDPLGTGAGVAPEHDLRSNEIANLGGTHHQAALQGGNASDLVPGQSLDGRQKEETVESMVAEMGESTHLAE